MAPVTDGDTLLLHFTSTRPDGEIFEDTRSGDPVQVTLGKNQINPLFEEALIGKEPGETVTVVLPPEKAYGKFRRKLVVTIKRKKLTLDHERSRGVHQGRGDGKTLYGDRRRRDREERHHRCKPPACRGDDHLYDHGRGNTSPGWLVEHFTLP
ncbi:protein of unknown function [Methanoculleus bourgensis]|uniref:Peptidyl-prolyl cis-trans isomerase n=1 Tax=Methanoculleus bourgensis TaxID=83986 RepID=A0A0X3BKN3_9EURY|nr:protein of unknown function [Methanoculleus bourgensis]